LSHSGASDNPYRYTGQQFDALTGLYSLRARYYDPALGRFLSRDPAEPLLTLPRALNRYVYVADNPLNAADPSGRQAFTEYSLITEEDEESAADFYVIGAISLGLLPEGDFALFAAGLPLGMRIALLVVTLASVAGPAIAPEAYLSPQSQTPSTSPIATPTPSDMNRVTLYRAIGPAELSEVLTTGTYGYSPSGGGKYFAYTYEGAVRFAKSPFNANVEMTITSIDIPSEFLSRGYTFNDVGGAGWSIHFSDIVLPELYHVMSPIRILGSP